MIFKNEDTMATRHFLSWKFVALMTLLAICYLFYSYQETIAHLNKIDELNKKIKLLESQNVQVWYMDDSCASQLKNSNDGVIRLKINK